MQDNGELIDIENLISLEDYKKIDAPFESKYENFGYVPFLDRAFNPTKDKLISICFALYFLQYQILVYWLIHTEVQSLP
jgi:hypothetical protein